MEKSYYAIIPANVRYDTDLTPNAKLLYGEITALSNEKGFCWATNSYFADLYSVSKTSVSLWIKQLIEKNYITAEIVYKEGSKEILHRYLKIVKDPIQDNLNTPISDNLNTPIQENLKENNTVINNTTINNTVNKKKERHPIKEYEAEFETLWKEYPRKKGKEKAKASYVKFRKKDEGMYERVQLGLKQYKRYIEVHAIGEEFIKHGATWFGNASWNDEYNLKRENQRQGFYGLWLNEIDKQNDTIIDYEGGAFYDTRGSLEIINDYPNFIP
jgi:hypothetical protein